MNKVQQARQIDWDLCMLAVRWAYRTMFKTMNTKTIPKVWNRVETIISEENTKRNLYIMAPVVVIVHKDQDKEIK